MDISNVHLRPFALMCYQFEAYQKQKCGQDRKVLWLKIVKICNLKLLEAMLSDLRYFFSSKLLKVITNFHLRPFVLVCNHFEASQKEKCGKNKANLRLKIAEKTCF